WKNGELGDQTKYPDELIRATRDEVEREFERICWPFVPRWRQVTVCAVRGRIYLPDMHIRQVFAVEELDSSGVVTHAWSVDEVASVLPDASGELISPHVGWWPHT